MVVSDRSDYRPRGRLQDAEASSRSVPTRWRGSRPARPAPAGRAAVAPAAVHPDEADARGDRRRPVGGRVVADVHGLRAPASASPRAPPAGCAGRASRSRSSATSRSTSNRGARPEAARRARCTRSMPLVTTPRRKRRRSATRAGRQPGSRSPRARELVQVGLAEPRGAARVAPGLPQQAAEALAREGRLRRLAAAEGGPQLGVDALVGGDAGRRARQAEGAQGLPQGRALGLVEVEQRVIDVEQDDAQAGQGATWRGR